MGGGWVLLRKKKKKNRLHTTLAPSVFTFSQLVALAADVRNDCRRDGDGLNFNDLI